MTVLGIDAGGTKTVCQLADALGHVRREVRGPGANLQSMNELEVEKTLHDVICRALEGEAETPAAICMGMAGVDRPRDLEIATGILARIGHRARLLVVNDALIALEAGVPGAAGIVVVAGTGSIAYGRDAAGRAARAGGWGYVLGDEGSGYWIGRQALRAVVRAADHRGDATGLTPLVLAHYHVEHPQDLVHEIYVGGARPTAISALASAVQRAAETGDAMAARIIDVGGRELAASAVSVATRLGLERGPVVLAGGTFRAVPDLARAVTRTLAERLPEVTITPLEEEPAAGAVHLALAAAADRAVVPVYVDTYR